MEPRRLLLGTLAVGERIAFQPAPTAFDAFHGEDLEVMVTFDYSEPSEDKDEAFLALHATLEGAAMGKAEEHITDRPMLSDDERGFLSVPVRATMQGELRGTFRVDVRLTRTPWGGGKSDERTFRQDGAFTLRVR